MTHRTNTCHSLRHSYEAPVLSVGRKGTSIAVRCRWIERKGWFAHGEEHAVKKSHTNTSDLLTWSETPTSESPASRSDARHPRSSDGVRKVVFGHQVTDEEFEDLNKRKPCSGYKLKEITGSVIFNANGEDESDEIGSANPSSNNRTGIRMYLQALAGISHISFTEEESISPKRPITLPEVAKQRELRGTLESEDELKLKKQISYAKSKELCGHDIFAPPPEILPRPLAGRASDAYDMGEPVPRNLRTSVKVSHPAGGHTEGQRRRNSLIADLLVLIKQSNKQPPVPTPIADNTNQPVIVEKL